MFNLFRKAKETGTVIKGYKVVSAEFAENFSPMPLIQCCAGLVESLTNEKMGGTDLNYGYKEWKNFNNFIKYTADNKRPIFYLYTSTAESKSSILYSNATLNMAVKPNIGIIDITISLDKVFIKKEDFSDICKSIFEITPFDYAYGFYLLSNQDPDTETTIKKGFFSETVTVKPMDPRMIDIQSGYLPEIYKFNLINKNQKNNLQRPAEELFGGMYFFETF